MKLTITVVAVAICFSLLFLLLIILVIYKASKKNSIPNAKKIFILELKSKYKSD